MTDDVEQFYVGIRQQLDASAAAIEQTRADIQTARSDGNLLQLRELKQQLSAQQAARVDLAAQLKDQIAEFWRANEPTWAAAGDAAIGALDAAKRDLAAAREAFTKLEAQLVATVSQREKQLNALTATMGGISNEHVQLTHDLISEISLAE